MEAQALAEASSPHSSRLLALDPARNFLAVV